MDKDFLIKLILATFFLILVFTLCNVTKSYARPFPFNKKYVTHSNPMRERVSRISKQYNVDPNLILSILSIIYYESEFNPKAYNGICSGLMQIYKKWHKKRAKRSWRHKLL